DARSPRFVCAPTRRPLAPTPVLDLVRHWFLLFAARRLAHCLRGKRIASRRITPGPENVPTLYRASLPERFVVPCTNGMVQATVLSVSSLGTAATRPASARSAQ